MDRTFVQGSPWLLLTTFFHKKKFFYMYGKFNGLRECCPFPGLPCSTMQRFSGGVPLNTTAGKGSSQIQVLLCLVAGCHTFKRVRRTKDGDEREMEKNSILSQSRIAHGLCTLQKVFTNTTSINIGRIRENSKQLT